MAIVKPFRGIRPSERLVEKIVVKPFDVLNMDEAVKIGKSNPISFLHISRPEINLSKDVDWRDVLVHQRAGFEIEKFINDGTLLIESKEMLYICRQTCNGIVRTGIAGCVSVDDYMNGIIKKHEMTRVEKENNRMEHLEICCTNTEPVILTYRDNRQIRSIIEGYTGNHKAEYDMELDGVKYELWAIKDDNVVNGICGLFKNVPNFYIADGHHRMASAYRLCNKKRQQEESYSGNECYNYVMAVIFPDTDLTVLEYNRMIKDLNGHSINEFLEKVQAAGFSVTKIEGGKYRPECRHTFGMYLDNYWYKLEAKEEIWGDNAVDGLDVSILQNNIISPILGIEDPRVDERIEFIGGHKTVEELENAVKKDMSVAFTLYPVGIDEVMNISDLELSMPPKSTWVEPKLATGFLMYKIQ